MKARWLWLAVAALAACPKHEADTPPKTGDAVANDSDPWVQAKAIAEKTGARGVARWKDDLLYLFQAKGTRGILVHKGAVVTARGPAAAGAYLRDTGILTGKSPSPDSLLTLFYVLHAFPTVEGQAEQSAIDTLGPADLQPRVELVDGHARVILNYALPTGPGPGSATIPLWRETLDIPPAGDAAWHGERFEHPAL